MEGENSTQAATPTLKRPDELLETIDPDEESVSPSPTNLSQTDEQSPAINKPPNVEPSNNVLSGDNEVDVDIEPDVKNNATQIHLCSCSIVFNCFTRNSVAKN